MAELCRPFSWRCAPIRRKNQASNRWGRDDVSQFDQRSLWQWRCRQFADDRGGAAPRRAVRQLRPTFSERGSVSSADQRACHPFGTSRPAGTRVRAPRPLCGRRGTAPGPALSAGLRNERLCGSSRLLDPGVALRALAVSSGCAELATTGSPRQLASAFARDGQIFNRLRGQSTSQRRSGRGDNCASPGVSCAADARAFFGRTRE